MPKRSKGQSPRRNRKRSRSNSGSTAKRHGAARRDRQLSVRDRQILLMAKTGIVTVEIVHRRYFADQTLDAARSAIRRLVELGYLHPEPLDNRRTYYRLTAQGARVIGAPSKCTQPLKKQGKADRYATSWFIYGDSPEKRALFNPHDYPDQFPVAGHTLPRHSFFVDQTGDRRRLGIIIVDHNAHARRIPRKVVKLLARFLRHGWFNRFLAEEAFFVAILTFWKSRKRAFDGLVPRAIAEHLGYPLSRLRPELGEEIADITEVYIIPGLDAITRRPQLDERTTMTKHDQQPPLLTVREVAEILRVSPSLVYQLVEASKLACHRVGSRHGAIRISAADIDVYLAQCRSERQEQMPKPPRPRSKHLKL